MQFLMVWSLGVNKNILIVESVNDKYFIEALIDYINLKNIEVSIPICKIDKFECLDGLSEKNLQKRFVELSSSIHKHNIQKIGIILDANNEGIQKRIELLNKTLKSVFHLKTDLKNINEFVEAKSIDTHFACFIMNIDGFGELETVLKTIKKEDSIFADCLVSWKNCLAENKKAIKDKDFDKFWLNVYQRYDCCSNSERRQAGKNCSFEASMKKDIWNFEHKILDDLKFFLKLFN